MQSGSMRWVDPELLQRVVEDNEARAAVSAMAPKLLDDLQQVEHRSATAVPQDALRHTLGSSD